MDYRCSTEEEKMMEEDPHINDLYQDMERLNALYEELMWDSLDVLEFVADYENDRIIITNKTRSKNKDSK